MTSARPAIGVRLRVLLTAEIPTPYGYVFRSQGNLVSRFKSGLSTGDGRLNSPCLAYIVDHPSAGVLLIDTGMHPDAGHNLRKDFGVPMSLLFRSLRPAHDPFDAQLRDNGVRPDEVARVVMTHLHVDHTSGMRLLPNATFICAGREWRAAHGRFAAGHGYVGHHLPPSRRMELLDFDDAAPYGPFPRTLDLLGDGTVRLLFTPGHTHGHQSVLLALEDGRTVLLVGDAAYTLRSIREEILPMVTADDEASRESLRQLKAFADAEPDAILVPTHDPDAWRRLAEATPAPPTA